MARLFRELREFPLTHVLFLHMEKRWVRHVITRFGPVHAAGLILARADTVIKSMAEARGEHPEVLVKRVIEAVERDTGNYINLEYRRGGKHA